MSETCACCRRPWIEIPGNGGFSPNRRDVSACTECIPHVESTLQKNSDHITAWRAVVERHDQAHAREVQQLNEQIESLRAELASRPEKVVLQYIDQNEMNEAKSEADRAFRSRDRAFRTLCLIRLDHRESENGRCRCGKRFDDCSEAQLVSNYQALVHWEKRQIARERQGLDHQLPHNHPALLDPRWNEWGDWQDWDEAEAS